MTSTHRVTRSASRTGIVADRNARTIKKICRDCSCSKPLDQYNRTPTGRCKIICAQCEDKREQTAAEKRAAYYSAYNNKAMTRKAAARGKWMAFAKGDKQAVDWGDGR